MEHREIVRHGCTKKGRDDRVPPASANVVLMWRNFDAQIPCLTLLASSLKPVSLIDHVLQLPNVRVGEESSRDKIGQLD
jgi:hypothetical protein